VQIRAAICDLDGIKPMVELIDDLSDEIKCLAAETIAYCCQNRAFLINFKPNYFSNEPQTGAPLWRHQEIGALAKEQE
jgi:hypothetical protein